MKTVLVGRRATRKTTTAARHAATVVQLDREGPATGRVVRVDMYPLNVAEQIGSSTRPLIDRLVDGAELSPIEDPPDLRGYVELALQGGFPEVALGIAVVVSFESLN